MRTLTVALALALSVAPGARAAGLERVEGKPSTLGAMMSRARAAAPRRAGPRPSAIFLDTTLAAFLFQGGGSVQGKNGTFFHSDAMIANYGASAQTIAVAFLAQGVDNSNEPVQYFTLPANTTAALEDYVAQTLGKSGFGAVVVIGSDTQGNPDSSATLDGQSRIWTFQPGSAGKVSLGLPAVDLKDEIGNATGFALGLRNDATARTNIGIVNLDTVSHTWTIHVFGENKTATFSVTVPPYSVVQAAVPDGNYGNLFFSIAPEADGFYWSAYGVSVDNITGDSWVSHVNQP